MAKKLKVLLAFLIAAILIGGIIFAMRGHTVQLLSPAGTLAKEQRDLMFITLFLSIFVVVPVFAMTIAIVWRYRENSATAKNRDYKPNWDHQWKAETLWWGIPCAIILVLAVITWQSTHKLDPYRALDSDKKPLTIQVVALQWKWLFIYPDQNMASVNFVQVPTDRPVNFEITADAPMNSFWIPQLGGQVYAMEGMTTQLHLEATKDGDYRGVSANLSGKGFAGMHFTARATSEDDFATWQKQVKQTHKNLSTSEYNYLAKPTENNPKTYYSTVQPGLYDTIVGKFMAHEGMSY